jgi:hypothetical protein
MAVPGGSRAVSSTRTDEIWRRIVIAMHALRRRSLRKTVRIVRVLGAAGEQEISSRQTALIDEGRMGFGTVDGLPPSEASRG